MYTADRGWPHGELDVPCGRPRWRALGLGRSRSCCRAGGALTQGKPRSESARLMNRMCRLPYDCRTVPPHATVVSPSFACVFEDSLSHS